MATYTSKAMVPTQLLLAPLFLTKVEDVDLATKYVASTILNGVYQVPSLSPPQTSVRKIPLSLTTMVVGATVHANTLILPNQLSLKSPSTVQE